MLKGQNSLNFDPGFPFHIREYLLPQDKLSFEPEGIFQMLHIQKGRFYYTNSPQQRTAAESSLVVIPPDIESNMRCARETLSEGDGSVGVDWCYYAALGTLSTVERTNREPGMHSL